MVEELHDGEAALARVEDDVRRREHFTRLAPRIRGLARAGVEAHLRVAAQQGGHRAELPLHNK